MLPLLSQGTTTLQCLTDRRKHLLVATRTAFPDMLYTIEALIAASDTVALMYMWTGTHRGELGGLPPTGRTTTALGVMLCRVAGGRLPRNGMSTTGWT